MNGELSLPLEFGASWSDFVRGWCLGAELGRTQFDVIRGLDTLKRLWPEHISRLVTQQARGTNVVVVEVELGCLLADCERVSGFAPVFKRLKQVKKQDENHYD